MRNEQIKAALIILAGLAFGFAASAAIGQDTTITVDVSPVEEVELSAESIRTAQAAVLNRIIREADNGDPAELLKLSQTLSTLQAAEGQQDALMVARAIEPQLEYLPEMVQTIQRQIVSAQVGNMLNEFRRHDEQMLPMMRGIIQVWGNSLDMGQKVQAEIKAADELAEAEQAMAEIEADGDARYIASTYQWKYVGGGRDGEQVYQITRKDDLAMDAQRDGLVLDYFNKSSWTAVEGQYLLENKDLDESGVLLRFDRWDWDRAEPKFRKLEQVAGPRRAQLISK